LQLELPSRLRRLQNRPVVVASHPRSGTHLLIDLLRRQFAACTTVKRWWQPLDRLYLSFDSLVKPTTNCRVETARALKLLEKTQLPPTKTHLVVSPDSVHNRRRRTINMTPVGEEWFNWFSERAQLIYVVRDGRDVLCSYHLWQQAHSPDARVPLTDFMRQRHGGMQFPEAWAWHVRRSQQNPNAHVFRFEDLVSEPQSTLLRLESTIGVKARRIEPTLPPVVPSGRTARLNRRLSSKPVSTAVHGRWRGRSPQRWKRVFTRRDHDFFLSQAGEILEELEYDTSVSFS